MSRKSTEPKPSVITTGIPLTERFKAVPSHNPLRPNVVSGKFLPESDFSVNEATSPTVFNRKFGGLGGGTFGGGGVNKLAVLRASKDAEILRLRAQLRITRMKLNSLSRHRVGNRNEQGHLRFWKGSLNGENDTRKRIGGGFVFSQRGKKLNIRNRSALELLGQPSNTNGFHQGNQQGHGRMGGSVNFFGEPKSKEDLDDELEKYMSKSKTKVKVDLDKELDDYMKVAKAQSFAGKLGLRQSDQPALSESASGSGDVNMEIS